MSLYAGTAAFALLSWGLTAFGRPMTNVERRNNGATTAFTDPVTNISFQRFFDAKSGFSFGIAMPQVPNTSFIGQLDFPLGAGGAGWGGWSLTGDMEGPLLMAAWTPDSKTVVSSFRQAKNEDDNPPEVTGSFSVRPIATGTSANGTHLTYTFLCEGCLDAKFGLGAASAGKTVEMGWALGSKAIGNPKSSGAILNFHDIGFGGFDANLAQAKFADFDKWAALAGTAAAPTTGAQPIVPGGGEDGGDDDDDDDDDNDSGDKNDDSDED